MLNGQRDGTFICATRQQLSTCVSEAERKVRSDRILDGDPGSRQT